MAKRSGRSASVGKNIISAMAPQPTTPRRRGRVTTVVASYLLLNPTGPEPFAGGLSGSVNSNAIVAQLDAPAEAN